MCMFVPMFSISPLPFLPVSHLLSQCLQRDNAVAQLSRAFLGEQGVSSTGSKLDHVWRQRRQRPNKQGVLRWCSQCNPMPHSHIKEIANSKRVESVIAPTPHNIYYKCDLHLLQGRNELASMPSLSVSLLHRIARSHSTTCSLLKGDRIYAGTMPRQWVRTLSWSHMCTETSVP